MAEPATAPELRRLAEEATAGPWAWRGYVDGSIELRALHSGGPRIISTHRLAPCIVSVDDLNVFVTEVACDSCRAEAEKTHDPFVDYDGCERPFDNIDTVWLWDDWRIRPANTWAVREQPYRGDVASVDHPDAAFIAAANPAAVLSLLDRLDSLEVKADRSELLLAWLALAERTDAEREQVYAVLRGKAGAS